MRFFLWVHFLLQKLCGTMCVIAQRSANIDETINIGVELPIGLLNKQKNILLIPIKVLYTSFIGKMAC